MLVQRLKIILIINLINKKEIMIMANVKHATNI